MERRYGALGEIITLKRILKNSVNGLTAGTNVGDDDSSEKSTSNKQIASWLKLIIVGVGRLVGDRRAKLSSF